MPRLRNSGKGDPNPGSLDGQSGILQLANMYVMRVSLLIILMYISCMRIIQGAQLIHSTIKPKVTNNSINL